MRRRRVASVAVSAVLALAGYTALDVYDHAPGILTLAPPGDPAPGPSASPTTTQAPPRPAPSGMPLPDADAARPAPSSAALATAVNPVLSDRALGGVVAVTVRDVATGAHLLDQQPDRPLVPASVLKLASAAAVADAFPPGSTLITSVVLGSSPGQLVLVAGGDTLLEPGAGRPDQVAGRAGLADLAAATAAAVRSRGIAVSSVALDSRYAAGPAAAPTWPGSYVASGISSPVTAIGLSTQRATPGTPGPRDPGAASLAAFAAQLAGHGVPAAVDSRPAAAPPGAPVLGSVSSAPVLDQLALALVESDNGLTESLTRQAAVVSGRPAGFDATAAYVREVLRAKGVDITGMSTVDASGLSRQNVVPVRVFGDVLALAAGDRIPGLRQVVSRLAVAGLDGTLGDRFERGSAAAAAGIARAKTGTLTGVNSLAGTVVTADGRLLTFAVLAQGGGTAPARATLDRFVTTLASCGCR